MRTNRQKDTLTTELKVLKSRKLDVRYGFSSDHLINGSELLSEYIAVLFTQIIQSSEVPREMCESNIIPIPKDQRKSLSDSSHYRSIAIGSLLLKILEKIVIKGNSHIFETSHYQFGFKKDHSTTLCTLMHLRR